MGGWLLGFGGVDEVTREQRLVLACKAALDALEQYTLCDEQDVGKDENDETTFGYVVAGLAEEQLVEQLKRAIKWTK